jgi:hypothetical protein
VNSSEGGTSTLLGGVIGRDGGVIGRDGGVIGGVTSGLVAQPTMNDTNMIPIIVYLRFMISLLLYVFIKNQRDLSFASQQFFALCDSVLHS